MSCLAAMTDLLSHRTTCSQQLRKLGRGRVRKALPGLVLELGVGGTFIPLKPFLQNARLCLLVTEASSAPLSLPTSLWPRDYIKINSQFVSRGLTHLCEFQTQLLVGSGLEYFSVSSSAYGVHGL